MMRMLAGVVLLLVAGSMVRCGEHICLPPPDAGWAYTNLITVRDQATGAVIEKPTFSESGKPVGAQCYGGSRYAAPDLASGPCPSWSIDYSGNYELTVSAPGYQSATVTIENHYTLPDGCPASKQVTATVDLVPL